MTPDDRPDPDGPTKPLAVDPETGATGPMVAPHVPVADVSTAPLGPVDPMSGAARSGRSRALLAGLIAAVVLLGITVIVFLTMYLQDDQPTPALTPTPSSSPTVTTPPTEVPVEDPPTEEPKPEPEPTTPPEPTDPPDPDPTETPAAAAP